MIRNFYQRFTADGSNVSGWNHDFSLEQAPNKAIRDYILEQFRLDDIRAYRMPDTYQMHLQKVRKIKKRVRVFMEGHRRAHLARVRLTPEQRRLKAASSNQKARLNTVSNHTNSVQYA